VVAAVAVVAVGTSLVTRGDERRVEPAGPVATDPAPLGEPVDLGPVFAHGNTLYLDDGTAAVHLPEVVQAIYYTSAGVLLRTNATGASDGGAPFHFSLVRADHTVRPLGLTLGEVAPGTDPRQPYVAYARMSGDVVQVVVHDVAGDAEVARVDVPGLRWSGGWEAPPVSLVGDHVYIGGSRTTTVVDWLTGEVSTTDLVQPAWPQGGGRAMRRADDGALEVVDVASGETVLSVPGMEAPWGSVAPDGRHATVFDQMTEDAFDVYALDTGSRAHVDAAPWTFGWTAGGDLYGVDASGLHECDSSTGRCTDTPLGPDVDLGGGDGLVVLGGRTYES
jgi:hypothetical protein